MYLSRLILNPRSRRAQREIADLYQLHRSLMRAFPGDLQEGDERVLFRLEADARGGAPAVLLQSWLEPKWDWLSDAGARGYLLRPPETKAFDLRLAAGQVLAFRLRANPTVKHWFDDEKGEKRPKRVGLVREEEQIEWLKRKGEQGGFRLLAARAGSESRVGGTIHREEESKTHKLTLLAVQFDGLLQVTDPDRLRETVRCGVGSGKGLGFGLLSLAPRPA
jgi:CRISPR system Cascade subunit CasE